MDDKLKLFYESLKLNPNIKGLPDDFEKFSSVMTNPEKSKLFYDLLSSNPNIKGLPATYEDFITGLVEKSGGVEVQSETSNETEQRPSFLGGLAKRGVAGLVGLAQMPLHIPEAIESIANLPQDIYTRTLINKMAKSGEIGQETADYLKQNIKSIKPKYSFASALPAMPGQETIGEALASSKVNEWLKENKDKLIETSQRYDKSAEEYFKDGEYDKAMGVIAYGIAESLPMTLAAMSSPHGALILGLGTGAEKYDEIKDRKDMSEAMKVADSFTTGLFEWFFEKFGSRNMAIFLRRYAQKKGINSVVKSLSSGPVMNLISKGYKKLGVWFAPLHEGISEYLTTVGQNLSMILSGERPDISLFDNAIDSFLIGTGMGQVFASTAELARRMHGGETKITPLDKTGFTTGPLTVPKEERPQDIINIYGQKLKYNNHIPLDQDANPIIFIASHNKEDKKFFITGSIDEGENTIYTGIDIDELKSAGYDFTKVRPVMIKSSDIRESMQVPYDEWLENEINLYHQAKSQSGEILTSVQTHPPVSIGETVNIDNDQYIVTDVNNDGVKLSRLGDQNEVTPVSIHITPDQYGQIFGLPTTGPQEEAELSQQEEIPAEPAIEPQLQQQYKTGLLGGTDIRYQEMPDGTFFIPAEKSDNIEEIIKQIKKEVDTDNYDVIAQYNEVPIPNVAPFARVKTIRVPEGISIVKKEHKKSIRDDNKNKKRISGQVQIGQESEQTKPEQEGGGGETPGGGILQAQKEEKEVAGPVLPTETKAETPVMPEAGPETEVGPEATPPVRPGMMIRQFVKGNHIRDINTGDTYQVQKITNKAAVIKNIKTKEVKEVSPSSANWDPVQREITIKQRKKPTNFNPDSKTARALNKTPESFEEAVMQFFIGGGKIWTEDIKRYITGNNTNELRRYFGLYSNNGAHMDVLHERLSDSFGIEEQGAMDEINSIVNLLRNPNTNTRAKMIDELLKRIESAKEEPEAPVQQEMLPEDYEDELSTLTAEIVEVSNDILDDPEIKTILSDFPSENEWFDVEKLLAKIEQDPGYFTIFPYGLTDEQLKSFKERLKDEQRRRGKKNVPEAENIPEAQGNVPEEAGNGGVVGIEARARQEEEEVTPEETEIPEGEDVTQKETAVPQKDREAEILKTISIVNKIKNLDSPSEFLKDLTLPDYVKNFFESFEKSKTSKYTWSLRRDYGEGIKPPNADKIVDFFHQVYLRDGKLKDIGFDLNLVERADRQSILFKNGVFLNISNGKHIGNRGYFYTGTQVSLLGVVENKLLELVDKGFITEQQAYDIEEGKINAKDIIPSEIPEAVEQPQEEKEYFGEIRQASPEKEITTTPEQAEPVNAEFQFFATEQEEQDELENLSPEDIDKERDKYNKSEKIISDWGEKIEGARKDLVGPKIIEDLKEGKKVPLWLKGWSIDKTQDGKYIIRKRAGLYPVEISLYNSKRIFDTEQEALNFIAYLEASRRFEPGANPDGTYSVFYVRRGDRLVHPLLIKSGFKTHDEAKAWIGQNVDYLLSYKPKMPERPILDNIRRTGKQYRKGNVTIEMFSETFGFRGGQFGNWVPQGERQEILNMAYDALMDLATALNVHPRALSLGGELAIAFGARGRGGKEAAAAHYEPDMLVLNLTRLRGAGNVAHEWLHALDHYFGLRNKFSDYKNNIDENTNRTGIFFSETPSVLRKNIRKEVSDAFEDIINNIKYKVTGKEIDIKELDNKTKKVKDRINAIIEKEITPVFLKGRSSVNGYTPPTEREKDKFYGLIEKIKNGEYGDKNENITKLGEFIKMVTNKNLMINNRPLDMILYYIRDINKYNKEKERADKGEKEEVTSYTKFVKDAKYFDSYRSSDYWTLTRELMARAFEAYVEDKISNSGNISQYLVHSTNFSIEGHSPYPEGEERSGINAAFDKLMSVIKTTHEEGDKVLIYDRAEKYIKKNGVYNSSLPPEDWRKDTTYVSERGSGKKSIQLTLNLDIKYESRPRSTLQPTEVVMCQAERQLRKAGQLNLLGEPAYGKVKIESSDDIAFLFRNLERASMEHAFAVFVDDNGNYKVLYVSTGTTYSTSVDPKPLVAAAKEFGAKKVYFIHNHPSGELTPSDADFAIAKILHNALDNINVELAESIIIDLDKGTYSTFNPLDDTDFGLHMLNYSRHEKSELIKPHVYHFDKQKLYFPSNELTRIINSQHVAEFLSKMKRGATPKIHALILDRANQVKKYLLYDETIDSEKLLSEITYEISKHGESVIFASNRRLSPDLIKNINDKLTRGEIGQVLDVIYIKDIDDIVNNYESYADTDIAFKSREPNVEYLPSETKPGLHFRYSDDLYFSTIEAALEKIKQNKGTPRQMEALLKKYGAKDVELDWIGWDDFVADKNILTKEEIAAFINENKIIIEEQIFDQKYTFYTAGGELVKCDSKEKAEELYQAEIDWIENDSTRLEEDENGVIRVYDSEANELFFARPSGSRYICTDINNENEPYYRDTYEEAKSDAENKIEEVKKIYYNNLTYYTSEDLPYKKFAYPKGHNYKELTFSLPSKYPEERKYKSKHWDIPNVFAHARIQTVELNNKNVLLVEEIQSDWAQEGRVHGFYSKEVRRRIQKMNQLKNEYDKFITLRNVANLWAASLEIPISESYEYYNKLANNPDEDLLISASLKYKELYNKINSTDDDTQREGLLKQKERMRNKIIRTAQDMAKAIERLDYLRSAIDNIKSTEDLSSKLPDMPFKQIKHWVGLTVRRLLKYAIDNGYDSVIFASGEMQIDRYNLRNYADSIEASKNKNGNYDLFIIPKNENGEAQTITDIKKDNLPDIIGKEMAGQIINDLEKKDKKIYEGQEIVVEQRGLKVFYNEIIPNLVNDILKPFGLSLGYTKLPHTRYTEMQGNNNQYYVIDTLTDDWEYAAGPYASHKEAMNASEKLNYDHGYRVGIIDINENLRRSLMRGIPIFRKTNVAGEQLLKSITEGRTPEEKNELISKIKSFAQELGQSIIIIDSRENLPDDIKRSIKDLQAENKRISGLYDEKTGEIYVILDEVYDMEDAIKVVLHELIGHKGVMAALGDKYIDVLREVYESMPEEERSRIRQLYGYRMTDHGVADEYIAIMAEKNVNPNLYKRIIAKIRQLLRKYFKISFSENDIHYLILQAKKFMKKTGGISPAGFDSPIEYFEALTAYDAVKDIPRNHGYGYYFTDINGLKKDRDVAIGLINGYVNNLSRKLGEAAANIFKRSLFLNNYKPVAVLNNLKSMLDNYHGNSNEYKIITSILDYIEQHPIPEQSNIQQFLLSKARPGIDLALINEDKPFSSTEVRQLNNVIRQYGIESGLLDMALWNVIPAKKVYNILASVTGSEEMASEIFSKAGFDGFIFRSPSDGLGYVIFSGHDIVENRTVNFRITNNSIVPPQPPESTPLEAAAEEYEKEDAQRTFAETIQGIREYIQDMNLPIRKFEEELLRRGGVQDDNSKPYRDTSLAFGRMEKLYEDYYNKKIKPLLAVVAEMIKSGTPSEFILPYVICKHAPERNKYIRGKIFSKWYEQNSGNITEDDAKEKMAQLETMDFAGIMSFDKKGNYKNIPDKLAEDIVMEFETLYATNELINKLWRKIKEATNETLNAWLAGGQISPEQYEELKTRYEYFVPLRGWRHDAAYTLVYTKGEGFSRSYMTAEGRKSLSENPLAYILDVHFRALSEQVDNEVKDAMLNLILANITNNEIAEMATVKKMWYVEIDLPDGTTEVIPMTERPTAVMFDSGRVYHKIYSEHEKLRRPANADEHEVIVRRPGGDLVMVFKDKWLPVAQALNKRNYMFRYIFGGVKDARIINNAMAGLAVLNNILKRLYTQWNVVFAFTNFLRDAAEGPITHYIKGGSASSVYVKYKDAFPAIIRYIFGRQDLNRDIDKMLDDFYKTGGATGFTHLKTAEEIEKDIKKEISYMVARGTIGGEMRGSAMSVLRAIAMWNRIFEDSTRFSIYLAAIHEGLSKKDAAMAAKDATINFNRTGKGTKTWDAIYAFFNPAIQGLQKNFKLAKDHPRRFSYILASFIILGYMEALMNDLFDDDDKDKDYYNINKFVRHNYLLIPNIPAIIAGRKSNKYLSIPLPQFWRGIKGIGSIAYDISVEKESIKSGIIEAMANIMSSLVPIDIGGFYRDGEFSLAPIMPTVIKPVAEILENRNYAGYAIAKTPFTKEQKKYLANAGLGKNNVSPAAKFFTDLLFRWAGGDNATKYYIDKSGMKKKVPAYMDINPSWIEHLVTGYTGGTGGFLSDAMTTVFQAINKEMEIDFRNVPFVNRFIKVIPEAKWNIIAEYYNNKDIVDSVQLLENEYEKKAIKGDAEKYEILMNNAYLNDIRAVVDAFDSQIRSLIKTRSGVLPDDNNEISKMIIDIMEECNSEVKKIKSKYKNETD